MKTFISKDFNNNSLFNIKRITVTNLDLSTADNGVLTPKIYVDTQLTELENQINTALSSKSDVGHTHSDANIGVTSSEFTEIGNNQKTVNEWFYEKISNFNGTGPRFIQDTEEPNTENLNTGDFWLHEDGA